MNKLWGWFLSDQEVQSQFPRSMSIGQNKDSPSFLKVKSYDRASPIKNYKTKKELCPYIFFR
jgi:hypothetical protein